MHQALYRKYRPQTFDDVYGQDHITSVLKYEVENNKVSHAYLFCGSRGTGKTTCAKILAKAVNCLSPVNGDPCGVCEACQPFDVKFNALSLNVKRSSSAANRSISSRRRANASRSSSQRTKSSI